MARVKMDGLVYFPFDVDFFDSRKIKVLRSRFGCEGVCLYIYLLCQIYRDKGYYMTVDEDFYAIAADDNGIREETVREIMAYMSDNNFFNSTLFDKKILSSTNIQKQYQECMKVRGRYRYLLVDKEIWLLDVGDTEDYILREKEDFLRENDTKKRKENKSKVNESKEKDNICTPVGEKTFFDRNVWLTQEEHASLTEVFGEAQTEAMIKKLSNYKCANGKEYESDYDAILSWVVHWYEKSVRKSRLQGKTGAPTFDAEEFARWEFENTYKK